MPISSAVDVDLALVVTRRLLASVAGSVACTLGEDALPDVGVAVCHPADRFPKEGGGGHMMGFQCSRHYATPVILYSRKNTKLFCVKKVNYPSSA